MLLGECPTGTGLEIFFEAPRFVLIRETDANGKMPGSVFVGVSGFARVVFIEAPLWVARQANVVALWVGFTLKKVDVEQGFVRLR